MVRMSPTTAPLVRIPSLTLGRRRQTTNMINDQSAGDYHLRLRLAIVATFDFRGLHDGRVIARIVARWEACRVPSKETHLHELVRRGMYDRVGRNGVRG